MSEDIFQNSTNGGPSPNPQNHCSWRFHPRHECWCLCSELNDSRPRKTGQRSHVRTLVMNFLLSAAPRPPHSKPAETNFSPSKHLVSMLYFLPLHKRPHIFSTTVSTSLHSRPPPIQLRHTLGLFRLAASPPGLPRPLQYGNAGESARKAVLGVLVPCEGAAAQ